MTASAIGSAPAATPSPSRQLAALVRMELLLLRRNLTATILSVVTPLAIGVVLISGDYDTEGAVTKAAGVIGMIAVFAVHHHLTTVYAARRQETVLRRLRAGLPSDRTILVGAASAPVLIFLVLSVLLVAYAVLALGMPVPANPLTMLTAMVLGAAVLAAFGAALSAITRSTEAAMLTTLPTVAIFLLAPGVLVPLGTLPGTVEDIGSFLPMGPFTEVLRTGWPATSSAARSMTDPMAGPIVVPAPGTLARSETAQEGTRTNV